MYCKNCGKEIDAGAAICVGCVLGFGAHTREEYVEIDSLFPGYHIAFEMILHHF